MLFLAGRFEQVAASFMPKSHFDVAVGYSDVYQTKRIMSVYFISYSQTIIMIS